MATIVGPEFNSGDEFRMYMARLSDAEQARQVDLHHLSSAAPSDEELAAKVPDLGVAIVNLVQLFYGASLVAVPPNELEAEPDPQPDYQVDGSESGITAEIVNWLQLVYGAGLFSVPVPELQPQLQPELEIELDDDAAYCSWGNELAVSTGLIQIIRRFLADDK